MGFSAGRRLARGGALPSSPRSPPVLSALIEALETSREGRALTRRAGMGRFEAERAAYEAAMAMASDDKRHSWMCAVYETRTEWMRAHEGRPTHCPREAR